MRSALSSPSHTHYGTQRSLDIELFSDPPSSTLRTLRAFTTLHTPTTAFQARLEHDNSSTHLYAQLSFASDASLVAVASASISLTTCTIQSVVVHTSHRQCGYGRLVVQQLLKAAAAQHAAVVAVVNECKFNGDKTEKHVTLRLFQSVGFEEQSGQLVRYLRTNAPLMESPDRNRTRQAAPPHWGNEVAMEYWAQVRL